ncbi:MAG TPA: 3'(2'),5'-bisphosphate nucleotidase [Anaerolineales bacterium]|nr:3'(2'),5'-bisphosphate nucleotidase [Anaerolineales bacterium]
MFNLASPEVRFAVQAVRTASQLVRRVQAELVSPALTKADRSPVTVADFASQALVGRMLSESFSADPLVGEEDSADLRQPQEAANLDLVTRFVSLLAPGAGSGQVCAWIDRGAGEPRGRFWTLDPIDGTKGFLRGDQYALALALIVDGLVQVAVLGCPNLVAGFRPAPVGPGSLAVGVRGAGAWVTSLAVPDQPLARLQVSVVSDPAQARLLRSFESGHTNVSQVDLFAQDLGVAAQPVRMDSQAKYMLLAAGQGELCLRLLSSKQPDYREKIWDQAAGSLIIEEAGGQVTDLSGFPLDFTAGRTLARNRGILASNRLLHPAALAALAAIAA